MEMGGAEHEHGIEEVMEKGNHIGLPRPLPKLRHVLDADGYKVELCKFCHGFGFVSGMNDRMDGYEDVICSNCNGTGRYMIRYEPRRLEFFENANPRVLYRPDLPANHPALKGTPP